jgi:hypothetical protein
MFKIYPHKYEDILPDFPMLPPIENNYIGKVENLLIDKLTRYFREDMVDYYLNKNNQPLGETYISSNECKSEKVWSKSNVCFYLSKSLDVVFILDQPQSGDSFTHQPQSGDSFTHQPQSGDSFTHQPQSDQQQNDNDQTRNNTKITYSDCLKNFDIWKDKIIDNIELKNNHKLIIKLLETKNFPEINEYIFKLVIYEN